MQARIRFLSEHRCIEQLLELYRSEGKLDSAADLLRAEGRYIDASRVYLELADREGGPDALHILDAPLKDPGSKKGKDSKKQGKEREGRQAVPESWEEGAERGTGEAKKPTFKSLLEQLEDPTWGLVGINAEEMAVPENSETINLRQEEEQRLLESGRAADEVGVGGVQVAQIRQGGKIESLEKEGSKDGDMPGLISGHGHSGGEDSRMRTEAMEEGGEKTASEGTERSASQRKANERSGAPRQGKELDADEEPVMPPRPSGQEASAEEVVSRNGSRAEHTEARNGKEAAFMPTGGNTAAESQSRTEPPSPKDMPHPLALRNPKNGGVRRRSGQTRDAVGANGEGFIADVDMPALREIPGKKWVSWPAKGRCLGSDATGEPLGDWIGQGATEESNGEGKMAVPQETQPEVSRTAKNGKAELLATPANPLPPVNPRKATRAILSGVRCLELAARQALCMPERAEKQPRAAFLDTAASLASPWVLAARSPLERRTEIEAKGIAAAKLFHQIVRLCLYCFEGGDNSAFSEELQARSHPPRKLPPTNESAEAALNADLWVQLASLCGGGVTSAEKLGQLAGHFQALEKTKGPGFGLAGELRARLAVAALCRGRKAWPGSSGWKPLTGFTTSSNQCWWRSSESKELRRLGR